MKGANTNNTIVRNNFKLLITGKLNITHYHLPWNMHTNFFFFVVFNKSFAIVIQTFYYQFIVSIHAWILSLPTELRGGQSWCFTSNSTARSYWDRSSALSHVGVWRGN